MAEAIQIDKNTWRFEDGFVRFFLLEGNDKAVMIDSGMNCLDAMALAKKITDKPLMLLNTHGDVDHVSGTGSFSQIYMHRFDFEDCGIASKFPDTALAPIDDGDIIDPGNRPLKIIHIPGHTKGSVAILDVSRRVLYSGDSVQKGYIFMFGPQREPEKYEASLDKLIALKSDYDFIYASHDEFSLSGDYAQKVKSAWQSVRAGEVPFEYADMFGNKIKSYTTKDCGFFMG